MDDVHVLSNVEVLTLPQLIHIWKNQYSLENILEFANKCHFGLYFKPSKVKVRGGKRATYIPISNMLKSFIQQSGSKLVQDKLISFCRTNRFLMEEKPGFARLATTFEVEILPICINGSIKYFEEHNCINGQSCNNVFGFSFAKPDDAKPYRCFAPSFYFADKYILEEDLFVFTDQIKKFEHNFLMHAINKHPSTDTVLKVKQKRVNALHELITAIVNDNPTKPNLEIWGMLKQYAQNGSYFFLDEVDTWSSSNPQIKWSSPKKPTRYMTKKAFQTYVSKIRCMQK